MKSARPIIVGVQNDDRDLPILAVADKLALKMDAPLLLVHSYESEITQYNPMGIGTELTEYLNSMGYHKIQQAKARLELTASTLKAKTDVKVFAGAPTPNLIAEAQSSDAWLILVGSRPGGHRFKWRSLSVALNLFNSSPLPVMVVNDNSSLNWDIAAGIHTLCADDLSKIGAGPAVFAAEFTARGGAGSRLDICHVNPVSESILAASFESALAVSHSQPTYPVNPAEIYENLVRSIKNSLCEQVPTELKAKITWDTQVVCGSPERQLIEIVKANHPHVAVFGKHKALHHKPFYFGKMPFSLAFELDLPFIVVPD